MSVKTKPEITELVASRLNDFDKAVNERVRHLIGELPESDFADVELRILVDIAVISELFNNLFEIMRHYTILQQWPRVKQCNKISVALEKINIIFKEWLMLLAKDPGRKYEDPSLIFGKPSRTRKKKTKKSI